MKCVILSGALCGWLALCGASWAANEPSAAAAISALKSTDTSAKIDAIDKVAGFGEKAADAVGPLTELLKDKSDEVRAHAAYALGRIGAPAKPAASPLVDLMKDESPVVRRQALKALMTIKPGPQVMIPLLVKMLEDSDPGIQARVLNGITEAGPAAVPGLVEALKNDKAAYWACLVARELGPVAKDAVPGLTTRLSDQRPTVRRESALALASMGPDAASAVPELGKLLSDETAAPAATYALGRIGKVPADVESKIQANAKGSDKMLSTSSLWAIGNLHPTDKAIRTDITLQLIARLKDEDGYVRAAAARALGALPPLPEVTVPIFEKALADGDEVTTQYALDALAELGPKAVPRLIGALKYEKLRPQVAYILGRIGPDAASATEVLAALLEDKDRHTAEAAAMALGRIGPGARAAVPALTKALQDGGASTHAVLFALGKIGPDAASAEPALAKELQDKNPDMAVMAAWALAQVKPTPEVAAKVVPLLTTALSDPEAVRRRGAAESLGHLGPLAKDAVPALEKATQDTDKSVSEAATKALASIKS